MPSPEITTSYIGSDGVDLGKKIVSIDYLMSVYPQIANQIITPELWTWGASGTALGINNINDFKSTPVTTSAGGANWKSVSGASDATLAIKTDGTLWTWGFNASFAPIVGDNTGTDRLTPVTTFAGGTNWKQVAGGYYWGSALKTDGTLWTWGNNGQSQLGDNTTTNRATPVTTFAGGTNWKSIAAGYGHGAAIKTDGTLWTWGRNTFGQLGNNTIANRLTPVTTFAGGTNWKSIACGRSHTIASKTDGTLWLWGDGPALGCNTSTDKRTPVTTFLGGTNWKSFAGGQTFTLAIKTDGTLWTWGWNTNGSLGTNDTTQRLTPVTTFAGGTNWKTVAAGKSYSSAALKTDGTLWVWGYNVFSTLGLNDGATSGTDRLTPVTTFAGGTNWKSIAVGFRHMIAIKSTDIL